MSSKEMYGKGKLREDVQEGMEQSLNRGSKEIGMHADPIVNCNSDCVFCLKCESHPANIY